MLRLAKILGLGVALAAAVPASADLKAGLAAWEKGDYARAVKEVKQPAANGDPEAQFILGQAYRQGRGVTADPKQAEDLLQKAAMQGQAQAQLVYATMLQEKGNRKEAVPWIERSAMRGDKVAQYMLGLELYNGQNVARDLPRAYAFMKISDTAGQAEAKNALMAMDKAIPADQREKGVAMATQISASIARTQAQIAQQAAQRQLAGAGAGGGGGGGAGGGGAPED